MTIFLGIQSPKLIPIKGYIKKSRKKGFLYLNVNNNDSHQRNTTCMLLYIQKAKKLQNAYIDLGKQPDTLQKERQYVVRLYSQKARHLSLRDFS